VGVRVGFVSDVHFSALVPRAWIEQAAAVLTAAAVDVMVLGGDVVSHGDGTIARRDTVLRVLRGIPAPAGHYLVPGNHDYAALGATALEGVEDFGWQPLVNRGVHLPTPSPLYLAGLDDATHGVPDATAAWRAHRDGPVLLVSHQPDAVVRTLAHAQRPWLALAGHLHGGQIRGPWARTYGVPTDYPGVLDRGFCEVHGREVFISQGFGLTRIPVRWGAPAEVVVVTMGPPGSARMVRSTWSTLGMGQARRAG
jgi:predicted MPP superfamily phosphohydrolase